MDLLHWERYCSNNCTSMLTEWRMSMSPTRLTYTIYFTYTAICLMLLYSDDCHCQCSHNLLRTNFKKRFQFPRHFSFPGLGNFLVLLPGSQEIPGFFKCNPFIFYLNTWKLNIFYCEIIKEKLGSKYVLLHRLLGTI